MNTPSLPIETLTPEAFAPYGQVLRRDTDGEAFQALFADGDASGWRVALLDPPEGYPKRIHRHPDSHECFAPMDGETLFLVASAEDPSTPRCFRLSEPICVFRNVWHEMFTMTAGARLFIAENAHVSGEEHFFDRPLAVG